VTSRTSHPIWGPKHQVLGDEHGFGLSKFALRKRCSSAGEPLPLARAVRHRCTNGSRMMRSSPSVEDCCAPLGGERIIRHDDRYSNSRRICAAFDEFVQNRQKPAASLAKGRASVYIPVSDRRGVSQPSASRQTKPIGRATVISQPTIVIPAGTTGSLMRYYRCYLAAGMRCTVCKVIGDGKGKPANMRRSTTPPPRLGLSPSPRPGPV